MIASHDTWQCDTRNCASCSDWSRCHCSVDMMCVEREDSLTVFCSLNKLIPPELQLHCHANDVLRGFYGRINPLASPSKSGLSWQASLQCWWSSLLDSWHPTLIGWLTHINEIIAIMIKLSVITFTVGWDPRCHYFCISSCYCKLQFK